MPDLGKKYTCYSCHTKFYDLGKPIPLCPKCGADQREAEEAPVVSSGRSRRVVEEPPEEPEFSSEPEGESEPAADSEEEAEIPAREEETSDDDDDDEEEEY